MKEHIFGHFTFLTGVTGKVIMKGSDSVVNGGDFVVDGVRVEGGGDVFENIGLDVGENGQRFSIKVVEFFSVDIEEFILKVLKKICNIMFVIVWFEKSKVFMKKSFDVSIGNVAHGI